MRYLTNRIINHPFFAGMDHRFLSILVLNARKQTFQEGDVIFREGEPASRFYLIESGRVALEAHEPADGTFPIEELRAGDVLGWSWLFPPFVWHFQARALAKTEMIVLDGAHLLVTAEQNKSFGYDLLKRISQTMIQRLQATRKRYIDQEIDSVIKT